MIRDRIVSPLIRAVSYDIATQTLFMEFTNGSEQQFSPVSYQMYQSLVHSRFPEKTYHQYLRTHLLS